MAKNISGENLCQLQRVGKATKAVISSLHQIGSWLILRQILRAITSDLNSQDAAGILHCGVFSLALVISPFSFMGKKEGKDTIIYSVVYENKTWCPVNKDD